MKNPTPHFILRPLRATRAGFTLLEIMLVVMIIALLASAAIYMMGGNLQIAEGVRVKGDIQSISTQITLYRARNGFYPSTQQGLQALVTPPSGDPQPGSWTQLMKEVPQDPWGNPYAYVQPGSHNPDFDLYSYGPDRKDSTGDEVGNWRSTNSK